METTLVIIKPDAFRKRLVGKIIQRIEECEAPNFVGMLPSHPYHLSYADLVENSLDGVFRTRLYEHYKEHLGRDYYPGLIRHMEEGPFLILACQGEGVVAGIRALVGPAKVESRKPGTIRGDWSDDVLENLIHSSDSPESAARELKIWFPNHIG